MRAVAVVLLCWLGWAGAKIQPWTCPLPGATAAWLGTGGPDAVAWIVVQHPPHTPHADLVQQAQTLVSGAFQCRADLLEVDLTVVAPGVHTDLDRVFAADPLMTLSVPRARLADWRRSDRSDNRYDRIWFADSAAPLPPVGPAPTGHVAWLPGAQLAALTLGGPRDGVVVRGPPWSDRVALTIDDGPHPLFTPLLLAALRREHLGATCFLIGRLARAYPYFVHDLLAQGIEVGNHSYAHLRPRGLTPQQQWRDLLTGQQVLTDITGRSPHLFRPPGGGVTDSLLAQAQAAGVLVTLWSDDPADYALHSQQPVLARLRRHLTRGGVLLLHDNAPEALDILPALAREVRTRGLSVVGLSDLLK